MNVPVLPRHCNSWIAVRKSTGAAVFETWDRRVVTALNPETAEVYTAAAWLAEVNRRIRNT